jgi:regulator of sirC expression with transglutaminase-like and TPR domain
MTTPDFVHRFTEIATTPEPDLASAALFIAKLEYPNLDTSRYLAKLDEMGATAAKRITAFGETVDPMSRITEISSYLFKQEGFTGNQNNYDDLRNSFLNEVLDRRTGIPISLSIVYIEVARRAGVEVHGINFPGHFLLKIPMPPEAVLSHDTEVIIDPFHGGGVLSESDCRDLLQKHAGDEAAFDRHLLSRASKPEILVRMLVNLKRLYVNMKSFPQAHTITELLLGLDPSAITELRDRGLLAYHLNRYAAALRDLEAYLRFTASKEIIRTPEEIDNHVETEEISEHAEIWEHVKALRRRVASFN